MSGEVGGAVDELLLAGATGQLKREAIMPLQCVGGIRSAGRPRPWAPDARHSRTGCRGGLAPGSVVRDVAELHPATQATPPPPLAFHGIAHLRGVTLIF